MKFATLLNIIMPCLMILNVFSMNYSNVQCDFCGQEFLNESGHSFHITAQHQKEINQKWDKAESNGSESGHIGKLILCDNRKIGYWYCPSTKKYFKILSSHLLHCSLSVSEQSHELIQNISCLWCSEVFKNLTNFTRHINRKHFEDMFKLWSSEQQVMECDGHIKKIIDISGQKIGYFYCSKEGKFFANRESHSKTCIIKPCILEPSIIKNFMPCFSAPKSDKTCPCSLCLAYVKWH